jgi:hypothetical protein
MQDNLHTADNVETTSAAAAPVELTLEELQQVGGGLTTAVAGPNDNW